MLRSILHRLPHGRARAARLVRHLRRAPFVDVVEPAELDVRLCIDPADPFQAEVWVGAYQPHVVQWIRQSVQPGDTVLCLGLSVGYIAALCRRLTGPGGRVFSAEPDAHARAIAERNLALGDDRDAPFTVFAGGLGRAEAMLALYQSSVAGHSSFAAPHQPDCRVSIPVQRGDTLLAQHGCEQLDVLVLDVEGWEMEVLHGLSDTLHRSQNLRACVELSPWALADARTTPSDVLAFLAAHGIHLQHLGGEDWTTAHDVASVK